ncbi:hypothetical protein B0I35DRAFT_451983 [Stachybotrys elegans]|uniref:AMP-dependent synthetase/ligase domain-containing protein n=1 Tax=Stachybotrys elegans TaxID=80388 RepID=A0A8K0SRX4_9HYPO|nr:hypothetical protein B0I35DRAFT_451983 [Stachybotrys elegans]
MSSSSSSAAASSSSTLPRLPIFEAIASHDPASPAVVHSLSRRTFTYGNLLAHVSRARDRLQQAHGGADLNGQRVAFLVENGYDYVVTLLAAVAARAIAVPLSPAFPASELQYILNQSEASLLVSSAKFASKATQVLATDLTSSPIHLELPKHMGDDGPPGPVHLDDANPGGAGMMLYTSGTTNRPKGVLLPQSVLTAQSQSLIQAWDYTPADRLLHVLPLHHIHGTVNGLLTPLLAGSTVEFMFPFNADAVWGRLAAPFLPAAAAAAAADGPPADKITFFTVVPTVYSRLLSSHKSLSPEMQEAARKAVSPENMRLAISGSAALPTPIKRAWKDLSHGNVLLERYGMTEVGMALSCGLSFADRVDASVGWPLPSVQARLVDVDSGEVIQEGEELGPDGRERSGEIQLRGPTIFKEYWRNPEATAKEFVEGEDGNGRWFKTGDVAVRRPVPEAGQNSAQPWAHGPMYFIQGRKSADIIKTGGEKVSALEVERELLSLPQIAEAAVVAVPSGKWGQKVGAVLVLDPEHVKGKWTPMDMRRALRDRLANYKIPQVMKIVDDIPRNAMGKINKKQLVKAVFADEFSEDEV